MQKNTSDPIGDRMKQNYELPYKHFLTRRMPAIIRVDMRNGHTFTSNMKKPFDMIFVNSMHDTAIKMCEQIMNVNVAYIQSDEISFLLTDYKKLSTEQWLNGNVQKIASISASMATIFFNAAYTYYVAKDIIDDDEKEIYSKNINQMTFDSRVFTIPDSEVVNYFFWRQLDATKNSIQAVGSYYFHHKMMQGVNNNVVLEKLKEKGINWNSYPTFFKRGVCTKQESYFVKDEVKNEDIERFQWIIDDNTPVFSKDRNYIGKFLNQADDH